MDAILGFSGTVLVAIIAAAITLYKLKRDRIAKSRIRWNENLRELISSYCKEVSHCSLVVENYFHYQEDLDEKNDKDLDEKNEILRQYYKEYVEVSNRVKKLGYQVLLHLNSKEDKHHKIEKHIDDLDNQLCDFEEMQSIDGTKVSGIILEIIKTSKEIFKEEWERAKKIW